MRYPLKFSQALRAVIKRAMTRYHEATGRTLSYEEIAREVGMETSTLWAILRGDKVPTVSYLLPLLVYLGCDEEEQRIIFHLAEVASPYDIEAANEMAAVVFALPSETDPVVERITEKRTHFPGR